ncbi:MAG: HAD-IIIC family phosphatase [Caulobacteraceae bacterium]|nr:HAD-IIIC family phosphatase [Caulobacteraceae bacterium]
MTRHLFADLAWLPESPADFRARNRALVEGGDGAGAGDEIIALATHALGDNQLIKLAETIGALAARGANLSPLTPFKLGIVGTGTLDLLIPALIASAARHGVLLECVSAEYGQIVQQALEPESRINAARCDAVLIALDYRSLPIPAGLGERAASVEASIGFIDMLREGFRAASGAVSIVQTFAPPPEQLFGSLDRRVAMSTRGLLDAINRRLLDGLEGTPDLILDIAALAETVGLAEWYSPEQWNLAKLPFSATYARLYADHVGRLLGALRGGARRCLILDLDNTVWGGVIGDDGLDGIRIAQGDATGEAFLEVQRTALMLRERGVVLAVSSKNTDEVARAAFREHPEMLLRENHIAVFQANWNDKATNIKAIAEELNLGLASMVFLDDNPVERGLVRRLLPRVAVPELPEDPALYARTLLAAGYFEAVAFSDEDRKRADFYQDNAKRLALQSKVGGVEAYLESLNMRIGFAPFDGVGRERISQLINKSNQFNLTTRRYTEAEVAAAEADAGVFTLQVRLTDVFGDNGMISVVIARPSEPAAWEIDTWLMSCRVLGRKVEQMVLRELVLNARAAGIERLVGVYRPTERNSMVQDHYAKLGFILIEEDEGGVTRWSFSTAEDVAAAPMTIQRAGLAVGEAVA